jgi:hypothetical protein
MQTIFSALLFITLISSAQAYDPIKAEPPEAYDVIQVEGDPYVQREYLGDLYDYPDMYELTSDVAFTLKVRVRQHAGKQSVPFGLIVVRQNDDNGGVTEVARLNQPVAEWVEVGESMLGMSFLEGSLIEKEITPGTYRIEVSTPDNLGAYMFIVGDEPVRNGFFASLVDVYQTQRHFGYTPLHLLFSSLVYYPLGILLVIYGIYRTWQYRHKLRHA